MTILYFCEETGLLPVFAMTIMSPPSENIARIGSGASELGLKRVASSAVLSHDSLPD